MARITSLILDVLKPHEPNVVQFAQHLAEANTDCQVQVTVTEMDDKTESLVVVVTGRDIDFDAIDDALRASGASLHSIDDVQSVSDE